MQKIKTEYEAKIIQDDNGWWRVIRSTGFVSGRYHTKQQAQEHLRVHFEQAKMQFGEKYEVVLKLTE